MSVKQRYRVDRKTMVIRILSAVIWLAAGLLVVGCSSDHMRYTPAELDVFRKLPAARELVFETGKGRQVAYYLAPTADPDAAPRPLVLGFPGIATRALDWLPMIEAIRVPKAGYLLIDYPGRGQCEGIMRPKHLPQTFDGALQALARETSDEPAVLNRDLRVLGHSFGTAAGLLFAQSHEVRRVVLLAPLTTIRRAMFRRVGPLAWLNPDNLDNREMIQMLLRRSPAPGVALVHGDEDDSLPLAMAWELQALAPGTILLYEIPGGTHVSILEDCRPLIKKLLTDPLSADSEKDKGK